MLSDFGGYLGLFIGASILYLYDISTNFFLKILAKLGNRPPIRLNELKTEHHDVKSQDEEMTMGDKEFQQRHNMTSTPGRVSYSENQIYEILKKIQEELGKVADMVAKHDNKINMLENKMHLDFYKLREKNEKKQEVNF